MAKIQSFTRQNKSTIHSVTIPKHIIEEAGVKKGDEVDFLVAENGNIVICKVN